jgi:hypothetical protein
MTTEFPWREGGEGIVWSGRPSFWRLAIKRGLWPFLLGIFLLSMAAFVLGMGWIDLTRPPLRGPEDASFNRVSFLMNLQFGFMGAIFGLGGLVLALAPVWLWFRARQTTYALTDQRVVIDTAGPRPRRTSIRLEHVRFIDLRPAANGLGDIVVQETMRPSLDGWGPRGEGFIGIADAAKVEQLLRAAIEATFSSRARRA